MRYEIYYMTWMTGTWEYWGKESSHEKAKKTAKEVLKIVAGAESTKVVAVLEEYIKTNGEIEVL